MNFLSRQAYSTFVFNKTAVGELETTAEFYEYTNRIVTGSDVIDVIQKYASKSIMIIPVIVLPAILTILSAAAASNFSSLVDPAIVPYLDKIVSYKSWGRWRRDSSELLSN